MARRGRSEAPTASPKLTPPQGGAYEPLSAADRDAIIEHAFELLAVVGMGDAPPPTRERLLAAGAGERHDGRLTFSKAMVTEALERSPSTVDLPGVVRDDGLTIGGGRVHIGTGGAAVQTLDAASGTYRASTSADLWTMFRVLDASTNIHYGLRPLVARDIDDPLELDLTTAFVAATATSKPTGVSFTSAATVDPVVDLFDAVLGSPGSFASQPFSMAVVVHVVPPLRFSPEGCEIIERAIERRFGVWALAGTGRNSYPNARVRELYEHQYAEPMPHRIWESARPVQRSPLYDRLAAKGARFGQIAGWERAFWFGGEPYSHATASYRDEHWHDQVEAECLAVRDGVGVMDHGGFTRYEVSGPGATEFLDCIFCTRLPAMGRVRLSYMLRPNGTVWSEATIARLDDDRYLLLGPTAARERDFDWLVRQVAGLTAAPPDPADGPPYFGRIHVDGDGAEVTRAPQPADRC